VTGQEETKEFDGFGKKDRISHDKPDVPEPERSGFFQLPLIHKEAHVPSFR